MLLSHLQEISEISEFVMKKWKVPSIPFRCSVLSELEHLGFETQAVAYPAATV